MTQSSALFDGYANAYDQWFITNDKVFVSELKLLHHCLKDIPHDKNFINRMWKRAIG